MQVRSEKRSIAFSTILLLWLLVGTLDIIAACTDLYLNTGKGPDVVLKYVASGVFGKEAFTGGTKMIWLGLLFHYIVALGWTLLFYVLFLTVPFISKYPVVSGILYGLFIWTIMNQVVVPNSNVPVPKAAQFDWMKAGKNALILICMIGLPLSLLCKKYSYVVKR